MLVGTPSGDTWLIEVKNPRGKNKLSPEQVAFRIAWPGKYAVVTSANEAIAVVAA